MASANLEKNTWVFHTKSKSFEFSRQGEQRGTPLVCLPELAKKLPIKIKYDPENFRLRLEKDKNWVELRTYSENIEGSVRLNNRDYPFDSKFAHTPVFLGAKLCFPVEIGDRVLRPLLESFPPDSLPERGAFSGKGFDVIIDPGHGGNDFGAHRQISRLQNFQEKDFVLQFAKELKDALDKEGVSSALTREGDHFLTLSERSELANSSNAKFFISLHMNSSELKTAKGYELYVLSLDQSDSDGRSAVARENQVIPTDLPSWLEKAIADLRAEANLERSIRWAHALDEGLKGPLRPSAHKSIRMGPFYILYGAAMPAVLVELGYLTNSEDRHWMLNPPKRKEITQILAKKIAKQLKSEHPSH